MGKHRPFHVIPLLQLHRANNTVKAGGRGPGAGDRGPCCEPKGSSKIYGPLFEGDREELGECLSTEYTHEPFFFF